jgi:CopG family nickel-responsive transcriptional regulator
MAVVSVSLPDPLLEQADAFLGTRGFSGRSDLVRAALRDFLAREAISPGAGHRTATLTLLYPDGAERKIGEIRHDYTDIIRSMMHGHTRDLCVEVFVLEGAGRRIQAFADALRSAKESRMVQATYTDASEGPGAAGPAHRHGAHHH